MSPYSEIVYDMHGHVGVITIDRPEARNALTFTTYAELTDAIMNTAGAVRRHHRPRSRVLFRR